MTIRDQAKDTLRLAVITGDKIAELKVDMKNVPTSDMIYLHKGIGDILYTNFLQDTLQIS